MFINGSNVISAGTWTHNNFGYTGSIDADNLRVGRYASGNYLKVSQIVTDCDQDSLLIACRPQGPTCHLGTESCFPEQTISQQNFLSQLEQVIASRKNDAPEDSYTAHLLSRGTTKMAQKVGEEGVEVALAAVAETKEDLLGECADLFYHTLVLLQDQNIELNEVMAVLQARHQKK